MADGANCGAQQRRSQHLITAHLHSFSLIPFFLFFSLLNVNCVNYRFLLVLSEFPLLHVWGLPVLNFCPELIAGPGGGQIPQISGCVIILRMMVDPHKGALMWMEFLEGHI